MSKKKHNSWVYNLILFGSTFKIICEIYFYSMSWIRFKWRGPSQLIIFFFNFRETFEFFSLNLSLFFPHSLKNGALILVLFEPEPELGPKQDPLLQRKYNSNPSLFLFLFSVMKLWFHVNLNYGLDFISLVLLASSVSWNRVMVLFFWDMFLLD